MKKDLERLNSSIETWLRITKEFPSCEAYKEILAEQLQERTNLVNKIGRNNVLPSSRNR